MSPADLLRLLVLAALWGSSFMFMRVLAPVLGPALTATARTLVAGLVLTAFFAATRVDLSLRRNWRRYLLVGLLNSALPFMLFSWAALHIPGSLSAVVNALTPLWGAILAALFLGERLGLRKVAGIALGLAGVVLISLLGAAGAGEGLSGLSVLPVLAVVLATMLYALTSVYIKLKAPDIPSRAITAASLLFAGLLLLPLGILAPRPEVAIHASTWLIAVLFSLLCSALAYLIYFRLIATAGVTRALSVTLLIPVFAFFWGWLFLGETLRPEALWGAALVLGGTGLITTGKRG